MTPSRSVQSDAAAVESAAADSLVVREHERRACRLAAVVSVAPDSDTRVTLSRGVGNGTGSFPAVIVDCSVGGIGIESTVFVPRGASIDVRVQAAPDQTGEPALDLTGTVKRAAMTSRGPSYYLGIEFQGSRTPGPEAIKRLMQSAGTRPVSTSDRSEQRPEVNSGRA